MLSTVDFTAPALLTYPLRDSPKLRQRSETHQFTALDRAIRYVLAMPKWQQDGATIQVIFGVGKGRSLGAEEFRAMSERADFPAE